LLDIQHILLDGEIGLLFSSAFTFSLDGQLAPSAVTIFPISEMINHSLSLFISHFIIFRRHILAKTFHILKYFSILVKNTDCRTGCVKSKPSIPGLPYIHSKFFYPCYVVLLST
jgi:hypothetical protein